ncbi:MAG: hypothetical protein A3K67_06015 [Euryarchaeota archaeon RBG_16_62_10]|nr:MAG: hypothetical protein A3K67_06015 [Euryarchaeota archaeon RBG_16_62_10]
MAAALAMYSPGPVDVPDPAQVSYLARPPIFINSDLGFVLANGVSSGSGTEADPFVIEGWDIDGPDGLATEPAAVRIENTTAHFVVRGCYLHTGINGIYFKNLTNGTAYDNLCKNNTRQGIYLNTASNTTLVENNCTENLRTGISVYYSTDIDIISNTCWLNEWYGLVVYESHYSLVDLNDCRDPVQAYPAMFLSGSNYNNVTRNTCSGSSSYGIYLSSSAGNTVAANHVEGNGGGILVGGSTGNTLSFNNVSFNTGEGIYISTSSSFNEVSNNTLWNNTGYCVRISASSYNTVYNNTFMYNNGANDILDLGRLQARDDGVENRWNLSGRGNYWADLTLPDADGDGIVDDPNDYPLAGSAGAYDRYPLAVPTVPIPEFGPLAFLLAAFAGLVVAMARMRARTGQAE